MTLRLGFDAWGVSGPLLYTGMGQYTRGLLRTLPRLAPDVSVVAYGAPREERPAWLDEAVVWRPVGRRVPAKLTALDSRLRRVPAAAREDRLDVLHAPFVHLRPGLPPVPRCACPVVVTLHDLIPLTYYGLAGFSRRERVFYRWNLRRVASSDLVLTVSETARRELGSVLSLPPDRLRAIHNGVDFAPRPDPGTLRRLGIATPYLLYAGSYEPRKNLAGAIRAFGRLVEGGCRHRLVAITESASRHREVALQELRRSGLESRVLLLHGLSEEDLRAVYSDADLLLFPSLAEGFGLPPVQAGACGVPSVVTDLPALREVLGAAAVYVPAGDDRALAGAVRALLGDPDERRRLGRAAQERARLYSLEASTYRHLEAYRELAARAARGGSARRGRLAGLLGRGWRSPAG